MSLLQRAPRFGIEDAVVLARERYGFDVSASTMTSERDQNFCLQTTTGGRFVLKIANAAESLDLLRAQNAAMAHLTVTGLCPRSMPDVHGEHVSTVVDQDGAPHFVRLVTWMPGEPLGTITSPPARLFEDLGRAVGEIDRVLESFDDPAIHRRFYWDLANGLTIVRERGPLVRAGDLRILLSEIVLRFEHDTAPLLSRLPTSAIHNDANDYNVLVADGRVTGLVDFGDMVYGWTVGDLAIAIAYAVLDKANPLATAYAVLRGYESVRPLTPDERSALFGLVRLRLAMSVCIAASQQRERPDDAYLTISQDPIRRTLPALMDAQFVE